MASCPACSTSCGPSTSCPSSKTVARSEQDDVAVAVVVGRDAVPGDAAEPAAAEVIAEGAAEDSLGVAPARVVMVDREIAAIAQPQREAVLVQARLEPRLRDDAVTADEA